GLLVATSRREGGPFQSRMILVRRRSAAWLFVGGFVVSRLLLLFSYVRLPRRWIFDAAANSTDAGDVSSWTPLPLAKPALRKLPRPAAPKDRSAPMRPPCSTSVSRG